MEAHNREEIDAALALAAEKDQLLLLTFYSEEVCSLENNPNAWEVQSSELDDSFAPCERLGDYIAKVAKECENVAFVELEGDATEESKEICKQLGITTFPSFQYWKNHELLWQHTGAGGASEKEIAEGILYYGGQGAGGEDVSEIVTDVLDQESFEDFLEQCALPGEGPRGVQLEVECDKQVAVIDVCARKDSAASLHMFPSIVALAKNTQGAVRFARIEVDSSAEAKALAQELGVDTVPSFLFFSEGKQWGSYAGTDRMKLVEKVLEFQTANGVRMPQPPPRKRMSTAEAKAIAKAKREKQGRLSGW
mmetsp:Transcript_21922/g.70839  ORF Transcript_21922/g.70839 Transcript_21922/m.70839 type:complete len:308 (+) Transcript_21922:254-1177(+)